MAKVKGASIVDSVRFLRRHKEKALEHLPPALHHYLGERVLAASWYPEEDNIPLVRAAARVLGEPERAFYEKAGRLSAQLHADGVYRHLVREGESQSLARRALVLWSTQHDTGAMDMQSLEEGKLRVTLRGYAAPSREACLINGGYLVAAFEISGYHDVRVEKQSCCVDGAPECAWVVGWSSKD
jgi:hypothetical protein